MRQLHLVLIFPFGALHFMNVPLGAENMLLPASMIFYCFLGCMVLAASAPSVWRRLASALLGVRTRAKADPAGYIALGIGIVLVIAVMILASTSKGFGMFSPFQDGGADSAIKNPAIFIALPGLLMMVAIDLIGTFPGVGIRKDSCAHDPESIGSAGSRGAGVPAGGVASGFRCGNIDLLW